MGKITPENKINQILTGFPVLVGHEEMIKFVLDIRETFSLEKVPFEIKVGTWSSGSLDKYYASVEAKRAEERLKKKRKQSRKGSAGWVRY